MKSAKKPTAETDLCPNCGNEVTVPKSTRSFICRSCDAVIKVVAKEDGVELRVVGKSVNDDPTYQSLEAEVADLRRDLDDLHARYTAEMARDYGNAGTYVRNLGVLGVIVGAATVLFNRPVGAGVAAAGLVAFVLGVLINGARKRARQRVTGELSDALHRVGAQRDMLQRKAARLRTQV
jgi:hypothetical protein